MIAKIHVCCQKVLWILKYDRSMIIDIGIIYIYIYIYIFRKWKTHHKRFQVDFNKRYIRLNNFTNIYIYTYNTILYIYRPQLISLPGALLEPDYTLHQRFGLMIMVERCFQTTDGYYRARTVFNVTDLWLFTTSKNPKNSKNKHSTHGVLTSLDTSLGRMVHPWNFQYAPHNPSHFFNVSMEPSHLNLGKVSLQTA